MIKGKIEFTGATMQDVQDAVDEAIVSMWAAETSGTGESDDGSFSFTVDYNASEEQQA